MCVLFFVAKNRAKNHPFDSFLPVFGQFETAKSSRPKAAVRRSCCASTMFLHGSFQRCCAEGPGSEHPERPTADPRSCQLLWTCGDSCRPSEKFIFLRAHFGDFPRPPLILLSSLSASVLATSRHDTPSTDEGILDTVCMHNLVPILRRKIPPLGGGKLRNRSGTRTFKGHVV